MPRILRKVKVSIFSAPGWPCRRCTRLLRFDAGASSPSACAATVHLAMHGQGCWFCLATRAWGNVKGSLATWRQRIPCVGIVRLRCFWSMTNGTFHCSNRKNPRHSRRWYLPHPPSEKEDILRWRPRPVVRTFSAVLAKRRASRLSTVVPSTDACAIGKVQSTTGRRVEIGARPPPQWTPRQWMFEQALFGPLRRHEACPTGLLSITCDVVRSCTGRGHGALAFWGASRVPQPQSSAGCRSMPARGFRQGASTPESMTHKARLQSPTAGGWCPSVFPRPKSSAWWTRPNGCLPRCATGGW